MSAPAPRLSPLALAPAPTPGSTVHWTRLYGASRALAIATNAAQWPGPVVVIAADAAAAARFEHELAFYAPDLPRLNLPDWETLPYDRFSPYQDITSERIATLSTLPTLKHGVVIVAVQTALHRMPPRTWLEGRAFQLRQGERLDREAFRRRLDAAGYRLQSQVAEHGDYAVRGAVIDVFPMGTDTPFRIDLFDDEIETLRSFDLESQRSTATIAAVDVLPAREFPLDEAGRTRVPPRVARRIRRQAAGMPGLSGRRRGAGAGRHRILPAAIF